MRDNDVLPNRSIKETVQVWKRVVATQTKLARHYYEAKEKRNTDSRGEGKGIDYRQKCAIDNPGPKGQKGEPGEGET